MQDKTAGKHYDFGSIHETIELIEQIVSRENIPRQAAYCIGNAVKYLLRCGNKSGEHWEDDVKKAENYLHRAYSREWIVKK